MKDKPSVTISTPCYNHKKYLPDYFESIISQTYKNIELIITDDISQDNSQKVIENYLPKLKNRFRKVIYIPRKKFWCSKKYEWYIVMPIFLIFVRV